jgi:hypothetical protein
MKSWRQTPMDYFVVDFVEPGKSMGRQMFFCESSMDKAEEIAKAWKISQNVLGEPEIKRFDECVFADGRFSLKPNYSRAVSMAAGMKALGGEKPEGKTTTPFDLLGKSGKK